MAWQSLACIVADDTLMASLQLREAAAELAVPLRFVSAEEQALPVACQYESQWLALVSLRFLWTRQQIGRARGGWQS